MKAIVTRRNPDGTYDDVGMRNRYVTGPYKTKRNLLRYGLPPHHKGVRVELFSGSSIQGKPFETVYVEPTA